MEGSVAAVVGQLVAVVLIYLIGESYIVNYHYQSNSNTTITLVMITLRTCKSYCYCRMSLLYQTHVQLCATVRTFLG